jgi:CRISPR-associated protein Csm4
MSSYRIYKLNLSRVHFGSNRLDGSKYFLKAETVYSALYIEGLKLGFDLIDENIVISDGFPYKGDQLFIPKPLIKPNVTRTTDDAEQSIKERKKYKKLEYIELKKLDTYLNSDYNIENTVKFGNNALETRVSSTNPLNPNEKGDPYRIGIFEFDEDSGIYFFGSDNDKLKQCFASLSSIGGKRSSGLGNIFSKNCENTIELFDEGNKYLLLSTSIPKNVTNELLENSNYLLSKSSGFVYSLNFSESSVRKKDMYKFVSGSVFNNKFEGEIFDVGDNGEHSVYSYSKPLFLPFECKGGNDE